MERVARILRRWADAAQGRREARERRQAHAKASRVGHPLLDSICDGCEGDRTALSYLIRVTHGRHCHYLVTCPPCTAEYRAAGAELLGVYS